MANRQQQQKRTKKKSPKKEKKNFLTNTKYTRQTEHTYRKCSVCCSQTDGSSSVMQKSRSCHTHTFIQSVSISGSKTEKKDSSKRSQTTFENTVKNSQATLKSFGYYANDVFSLLFSFFFRFLFPFVLFLVIVFVFCIRIELFIRPSYSLLCVHFCSTQSDASFDFTFLFRECICEYSILSSTQEEKLMQYHSNDCELDFSTFVHQKIDLCTKLLLLFRLEIFFNESKLPTIHY